MNLPQTPRPLAHIALASGCCDLAGCVLAAWGWVVMSFVVAVPEALAAAASDVANIGSALSAANAAAAAGTTGLLAAGADEVSAALASLFSGHAVSYQQVAAQATALHDQFVQALTGAGGSYALTEAANVQQNLLNAINAPTQALLGAPVNWRRGCRHRQQPPTGKMAVCCSATGAPATTAPPRPEWPAATAATPD